MKGALTMLIPLIKSFGLTQKINENAPQLLSFLDEKIMADVELTEHETQTCLFVFNHVLNGEQTKVVMNCTINKDFQIVRKLKFIDLKKELQNLDFDKLLNNISLDGRDEEE